MLKCGSGLPPPFISWRVAKQRRAQPGLGSRHLGIQKTATLARYIVDQRQASQLGQRVVQPTHL